MLTINLLRKIAGVFYASVLLLALPLGAQESKTTTNNLESKMSVEFLSPAYAQSISDWNVDVKLKYGPSEDLSHLRVDANGHDVTDVFRPGKCDSSGCVLEGRLGVGVQIESGWNYLMASIQDDTGASTSTRLQFEANAGTLSPTDGSAAPYAVPVQMNANGTIEVGYTPEAGNVKQIYPGAHECNPTGTLTLVVLNRATLGWKDTKCFSAAENADLQTYLSTLSKTDLVLGTTSQGRLLGRLDLSKIGGTDWSKYVNYISDYSIIGYGQGSRGIATEAYNDRTNLGTWRGLKGDLINVSPDNVPAFSFRATDAVGFAVIPRGSTATVTVGNTNTFPTGSNGTPPGQIIPAGFTSTTYTSPALTGPGGGVWVLVLDRKSLALLRSSTFSATISDGRQNQNQTTNLYNALNPLDSSMLVFVTVLKGSSSTANAMTAEKFPGADANVYWGVINRIGQMGVPELAFDRALGNQWTLGWYTASFSMVGVPYSASNNSRQWYSSDQDISQGETGTLVGTLTRDRTNHYAPNNVHPYDTSRLGSNWTVNDLLSDSLGEAISSAAPVSWPLYDTPGRRKAYAYLSKQLVKQAYYGGGECLADLRYCQDIRFYYTGSQADTLVKKADPDKIPVPSVAVARENGFEPEDFTAAVRQIKLELSYLGNVYAYQQWFQSVNTDASINIATTLVTAGTKVATDLNAATGLPSTEVSKSKLQLASDLLKVGSGVSSAIGKFVPQAAVASGIFSASASLLDFIDDYNKPGPQPDPYVTQLGDLLGEGAERANGAAGKFNHDLQASTATFFNGIYSDWFKLQTVGLMTVNPDAPAWYRQQNSSNLSSGIGPSLVASARRSFYMQTIGQYFGRKTVNYVAAKIPNNPLVPNKYSTVQKLDDAVEGIAGLKGALPTFSWNTYDMVPVAYKTGLTTDGWWMYVYAVLKKNPSATWREPLGMTLMGPANSSTGEGNLNIPRELLFNAAIYDDLGTYKGPGQ